MTTTPTTTTHRRKPTHSLLPLTNSILMASLLSLSLLSFICFLSLSLSASSAASHGHLIKPKPRSKPTPSPKTTTNPPEILLQACKATRFPDVCQSSLSSSSQIPPNPTPLQVIQSALSVSSANLKAAQSMVKSILDSSAGNINRTSAANNCLEVLANSMHRISSSTDGALPRGRAKDARAWMSAALLYQYDCWNALKYANDTSQTDRTMSFLSSLMTFTSNALSMIVSYDLYADEIASWGPPRTERDGFWGLSGSGDLTFRGGFPSDLTADVTVCKDGSNNNKNNNNNGCYKTVQEAVNAAPDNQWGRKFVIRIKEGVYDEIVRVPLEKTNVVFLGDGMGKTVITGSLNAGQPGISTYNTATVGKSQS